MDKWIALFSHTGNEIHNISQALGRYPDTIITNNTNNINKKLESRVVYTEHAPSTEVYNQLLEQDAVITMHGWMRIVPDEICREYTIYNLHPGLITKYPQLKGKDPQDRVFSMHNKPATVGCVIHRTIGQVDTGEVLMEREVINEYNNVADLTTTLHEIAGDMWVEFLRSKFDE